MNEEGITKKEDIINILNAFKESRILLTAIELNIFTHLDTHMLTPEQLIEKTETDLRATERLLAALIGLGVIHKTKTKYYNTDLAKRFLNKNSSEYFGMAEHTNNLWNTWSTLTNAVKIGSSVVDDRVFEQTKNWNETFIQAMHNRSVHQTELISYMVDLSDVKKMLDVGGGSGAFTFAFLKKNENIEATIFDLPEIIPIMEKYIADSGLKDRIKILGGDYLVDEFPDNQDMIFLSAIVHINSMEDNFKLIKKCAESLAPGGKVVVLDYLMSEDRVSPYSGAIFALNMLVGTKSGDTYTKEEVTRWYEAAGLSDLEFKLSSFGTTLVIGKK